jgi:hypothetical protein
LDGVKPLTSLNYKNKIKIQHNQLLLLNNNLPFFLPCTKGGKKIPEEKKKKRKKKRRVSFFCNLALGKESVTNENVNVYFPFRVE